MAPENLETCTYRMGRLPSNSVSSNCIQRVPFEDFTEDGWFIMNPFRIVITAFSVFNFLA